MPGAETASFEQNVITSAHQNESGDSDHSSWYKLWFVFAPDDKELNVPYNNEGFLMRFLRPCKFYPESAHELVWAARTREGFAKTDYLVLNFRWNDTSSSKLSTTRCTRAWFPPRNATFSTTIFSPCYPTETTKAAAFWSWNLEVRYYLFISKKIKVTLQIN